MSRRTRSAGRWIARALASILVLAAVAAGALAWRLARGPISLEALAPRISRALSESAGRFRVRIAGCELAWAGWERGLDLRARDVEVLGPDDATIARFPAVAIDVDPWQLLRGAFTPTSIEVLQPSLRLVRHPDGTIDLGVEGAGVPAEGDAMLADVVRNLASDGAGAAPGLRRVGISDGRVVVEDAETGEVWRMPAIDVSLVRRGGAIAATLRGESELGPDRIAFRGSAEVLAGGGATAELELDGIHPAAIAARLQASPGTPLARRLDDIAPVLERIDLRLDGKATLEVDATWKPERVAVRLEAQGGTLAIGDSREPVRSLAVAVDADLGAERVTVQELTLDLGGPRVRATATLQGLAGDGTLAAEATVTALPLDLAWRTWPKGLAEDARAWLTANTSQGTVPQAHARLDAAVSGGDVGTVHGVQLTGDVRYDGLRVRFVDTMPAVVAVRGRGTFTQSGFDLGVESGKIEGVAVGPARVVISGLDATVPRIAIDASVKGPVSDTLRVLDAPPVEVAHAIGIAPAAVSGAMDGKLHFAFALAGDVGLAQLGLRAEARLSGVSIANALGDWSVTGGDLRVGVDTAAVTIHGRAAIAGNPAEVTWRESLRPQEKVQRTYAVTASVDSAGRKALGLDAEPFVQGPIGVALDATQSRGAPATIQLSADLAPATVDVPQVAWRKAPGVPATLTARLTVDDGRIAAIDSIALDGGSVTMSGRALREPAGEGWKEVDVAATFAGDKPGEPPGRLQVRLDAAQTGYRFRVASNDSGALFRSLGLFADADGGDLKFAGTLQPAGEGWALAGHVEIDSVTISRAPWLARAATLASLRGIADAFSSSGEGIEFDRVSGDLGRKDGVTTMSDGVAAGRTLGLLLSGSIDEKAQTVDLRGTLVPELYGLNRALQKIPLVGWVIAGDRPGGPVGVDFSVSGSTRDPKVAVHPLDSLTPAVLGRLVSLVTPTGSRSKER